MLKERKVLTYAGRAKKIADDKTWTSKYKFEYSCTCNDLFITPSGHIKTCGCEDSPVIGHVQTYDWDKLPPIECYKERIKRMHRDKQKLYPWSMR